MKHKWKLLKKRLVYPQKWVEVERWRMRLPAGRERDFYINRGNDFVIVCAITKAGQMVALKQYYVNIRRKILSLVAGYIDKGETPSRAARRELREETGYEAGRLVALGTSIKGKYMTGTVHYYLALGARRVGKQHLEESEDIAVATIGIKKFQNLVATHQFRDAFVEVGARRAMDYFANHNYL